MIVCKCINKIRKGNKIIGYTLMDNSGEQRNIGADELKLGIKKGNISVSNLKITSDGRLIESKQEQDFPLYDIYNYSEIQVIFKRSNKYYAVGVDGEVGLIESDNEIPKELRNKILDFSDKHFVNEINQSITRLVKDITEESYLEFNEKLFKISVKNSNINPILYMKNVCEYTVATMFKSKQTFEKFLRVFNNLRDRADKLGTEAATVIMLGKTAYNKGIEDSSFLDEWEKKFNISKNMFDCMWSLACLMDVYRHKNADGITFLDKLQRCGQIENQKYFGIK